MKARSIVYVLFCGMVLSSCSKNDGKTSQNTYVFEFNTSTEGWTGDFADYPITDSVFYELQFAHASLPSPLDGNTKALKLSGNNHSDDLFMFIKRKITGLLPNTAYDITYDLEFASKAPTNAIGVGGSPGEGVALKVGASSKEPKKIAQNEIYRMNIDKADQQQSGADMKVIGHVGVSDTTTVFTIIRRDNKSAPFRATTNTEGSLWLIIGTDSGFEAATTLYFRRIEVIVR